MKDIIQQEDFSKVSKGSSFAINEKISAAEVRLVFGSENLGIVSKEEALKIAREKGLDLVEVGSEQTPPVCKIVDYGKFKYEGNRTRSGAKKNRKSIQMKSMKFRLGINPHDYSFKLKHIIKFLKDGDKVRVILILRGREATHQEMVKAFFDRIIQDTQEYSKLEDSPDTEGTEMSIILVSSGTI